VKRVPGRAVTVNPDAVQVTAGDDRREPYRRGRPPGRDRKGLGPDAGEVVSVLRAERVLGGQQLTRVGGPEGEQVPLHDPRVTPGPGKADTAVPGRLYLPVVT